MDRRKTMISEYLARQLFSLVLKISPYYGLKHYAHYTEAVSYLNMIRTNRGLREVSFKKDFGNNRESLIAEIFEERRRELMGEGWRWYDLVRRQKLMKDNETFLRLISSGGIYWPVSEDIITANSQIEQNEFWK